jgi:hypothetical protein
VNSYSIKKKMVLKEEDVVWTAYLQLNRSRRDRYYTTQTHLLFLNHVNAYDLVS